MKLATLIVASSLIAASFATAADESACDKIMEANVKTGSSGAHMTSTGYAFAKDTPRLYGLGDHTCRYLRDEMVDSTRAAVYLEQYKANSGSTVATIWISKTTGRLLREEQDGDIVGKGKGHISYRWTSKP
jgi:hypothetical protein